MGDTSKYLTDTILSILMQVSRISIRNQYDTRCANTGSPTLIINDNNAHIDITMSCSCLEKGNSGGLRQALDMDKHC